MNYTEIMVRYGELSTKGKNRKDFISRLNGNVTKVMRGLDKLSIRPHRDRMHIQLNGEDYQEVITRLRKVFGIQTFSPSIKIKKDFEEVKKVALEMMQEVYEDGMTFKVNTRRSDHEFELDTNEINLQLGDYIFTNIEGIQAEMRKPDVKLLVEVRQDGIYLSNQVIKGAGGMPVGTAGKAELMLSGGIDSPVAGYLAMKRGVEIEMVHFYSPPYTSENALRKAKELTGKLAAYSGPIKFIAVPFTEIQETIKSELPEGYLMTIQRRFMMRLTDLIRERNNGLAIFNGEAVGQVASQTLESMVAINDVTNTPILRPVSNMDKNEIIEIAEDIDTFDLSVQPYEDCCTVFAPPSPKTRPNLEKARFYESKLDVEGLIQRSIDGIVESTVMPNEEFLTQEDTEINELL